MSKKLLIPALLAAAAVAVSTPRAQAAALVGNIDVIGSFTSTLLGLPDANLLTCTAVNLGLGTLNTANDTGVFAGLGASTSISVLALPIICKPVVIPPLLSVINIGAYTFTFVDLALSHQTAGLIELGGLVTITDGNLGDTTITTATLDINAGAGFELICGTPAGSPPGGGGGGTPSNAPDSASSVALLGSGLAALGAFSRVRRVVTV
jgi:hypothetical protein